MNYVTVGWSTSSTLVQVIGPQNEAPYPTPLPHKGGNIIEAGAIPSSLQASIAWSKLTLPEGPPKLVKKVAMKMML